MTGVQLSLFGEKTDEEKVRDWIRECHEHVQRFWKRDIPFDEFLESRFTGWEGGSCGAEGFDFFAFTPTKLELGRDKDGSKVVMTKRKVFDLFGIPMKKSKREEDEP